MKIIIVLPTKNESKTIQSVLSNIKQVCGDEVDLHKVIVTDDSTDSTRKIAEDFGATVVIGGGRGLGAAMYSGLKTASREPVDIIVSMDSDGQVDPKEIFKFIAPIKAGEADLVIGSRFLESNDIKYKYPLINRFGTIVLAKILTKFTGQKITDSHGGIRAMRREVADSLELIGTHTYVQETIIDAKEKGYKILEIPSVWLPRKNGKSRVVLSIPKYIFYTLPVLLLRSGSHMKVLFPLGITFLVLSVLDIFIVLVQTEFSLPLIFERQSFNLMLLLFGTGLNLLLFGFILELIGHLRRKAN